MATFVALLRAINVAGHNKVAMSELCGLFEELGFAEVKTLLQSGNIVFQSDRRTAAALERLLEKETAKRLDMSADYFVRSAAEWMKITKANPFPNEATEDPGHLVVVFLKSAPTATKVDALRASIKGREVIRCDGKQLYAVYPDGIGRSKLTGTLIEQKLGVRGTARNWNTILKTAALCKPA